MAELPHFPGGHRHQVRRTLLHRVLGGLDVAHVPDVLGRSLLAPGHDEAAVDRLVDVGRHLSRPRGARADRDVDERAHALVLAEVAPRAVVALGLELDALGRVEADEGRLAPLPPQADGFEARADGAGLAAVLVEDDVRLARLALKVVADEVDLCLDGRQVALRAALQHEPPAEPREVGRLGHVEEHVPRQHGGQAGEDFLRLPAVALDVGDFRLEEQHAPLAEHRHLARRERRLGELLDRVAETAGDRLEEVPVAGRAGRVQPEVLHPAAVHHDDLDVLAADVDDDVRVLVDVQRGVGVRHRFDQRRIAGEHVLQNVLGVAGRDEPRHLDARPLRLDLVPDRPEHLDGVLDRVAARQLVRLGQHASVLVEQHGLGGGRPRVEADERPDLVALRQPGRLPRRPRVQLPELGEVHPRRADGRGSAPRLPAPAGDRLGKPRRPQVLDRLAFAARELDAAQRAVVLGHRWRDDEVLRPGPLWQRDAPLAPAVRDVRLPGLAQRAQEGVRPPEKQHSRRQGASVREHAQVLQDDGVEQRRHQLLGRDAAFLEAVDVGLGEHAALAGDRVDLQADVGEGAERVGRDLQLGGDLVDHHAGAAGALVVHRDRLARPPLALLLEDDDLGVLPAELDDRAGVGVAPFDGQHDGRHFLHVARADELGVRGARDAGDEGSRLAARDAGLLLETRQHLEQLFGRAALVALVVPPDDLVGTRVDRHGLDGGGSGVEAEEESGFGIGHGTCWLADARRPDCETTLCERQAWSESIS